jgi:hypothetical protein
MNGTINSHLKTTLANAKQQLIRTVVRPLTSHSSRRVHELRWVTTAGERHADPPLPGDVGRLG